MSSLFLVTHVGLSPTKWHHHPDFGISTDNADDASLLLKANICNRGF